MSLRKRLTLLSAAGIALVLIVGSAATYLIERQQLRGQVDASLARDSTLVFFGQQRVTRPATGNVVGVPSKQLPNLPQSAGKKVTTIIGPRPAFGSTRGRRTLHRSLSFSVRTASSVEASRYWWFKLLPRPTHWTVQ